MEERDLNARGGGTGAADTLMLGGERSWRLEQVSKATRIPMSELVRLSVDCLIQNLGDPTRPDMLWLAQIRDAAKPANRL